MGKITGLAIMLFLSATIGLAGCTTQPTTPTPAATVTQLEGPVWVLESYGPASDLKPVEGEREITATFIKTEMRVSGSGGCNQYNAGYTLYGNSIKISAIASTKMACEPPYGTQESDYFQLLGDVSMYKIENGKLTLSGANGDLIYNPQQTPKASGLEGNKWILESYGEQSNPLPVQGPRQINVEFNKASGTVSGNGGCNQYSAGYTLNGNRLSIGMIASTEMACEPGMSPNEYLYLETLRAVNEYKVENGKLILSGAKGVLIYNPE